MDKFLKILKGLEIAALVAVIVLGILMIVRKTPLDEGHRAIMNWINIVVGGALVIVGVETVLEKKYKMVWVAVRSVALFIGGASLIYLGLTV